MGLEAIKAIGPMAGMLFGPMLGGLTAPEGQELSSFEGKGAIDPVNMLNHVNDLIGRIGQGVTDRAATPVSVPSAYVQQPGVYTGGGMPMPIGLVGMDPALSNPSLLNLQGMGQFQNIFNGVPSGNNPTNPIPKDWPDNPDDPNDPGGDHGIPPWMKGHPMDPTPRPDDPMFRSAGAPGLDMAQHIIPAGPDEGGPDGRQILDDGSINDGDIGFGRRPVIRPTATRRKRYAGQEDLTAAGGSDDMERAIGAAKLLLQNMQ
jgi:hypothetical protein